MVSDIYNQTRVVRGQKREKEGFVSMQMANIAAK